MHACTNYTFITILTLFASISLHAMKTTEQNKSPDEVSFRYSNEEMSEPELSFEEKNKEPKNTSFCGLDSENDNEALLVASIVNISHPLKKNIALTYLETEKMPQRLPLWILDAQILLPSREELVDLFINFNLLKLLVDFENDDAVVDEIADTIMKLSDLSGFLDNSYKRSGRGNLSAQEKGRRNKMFFTLWKQSLTPQAYETLRYCSKH